MTTRPRHRGAVYARTKSDAVVLLDDENVVRAAKPVQ